MAEPFVTHFLLASLLGNSLSGTELLVRMELAPAPVKYH